MTDHTYMFLFNTKEETENCSDIIEMLWPNTKIFCTTIMNEVTNKELFICAVQLGFRINWATLYKRLGFKLFRDCIYLQRQNIKESMDHVEEFKERLSGNLNVCFRNDIPSINIAEESEKEISYKSKSVAENSNAKRARWN